MVTVAETQRIPTRPDELTPRWLTGVLAESDELRDAEVASVEVLDAGEDQGMTGQVVRLKLTYTRTDLSAPDTMIAKLPAIGGPTRAVADRLRLCERELGFYREVADRVPLRTPALYAGQVDEAGNSVLLLEDVRDARTGDLLRGATLKQVGPIVEELARLHARWWDDPDLERLSWLPAPDDERVVGLHEAHALESWRSFSRKFGQFMPPNVLELGRRVAHDRSVMDRLAAAPRTFVHGDMRINNVLFAGTGSQDTVIDWQTVTKARGPIDIASLFVSSLAPDDRRRAESELLPRYHRLLLEGGVRDYTYEQCWLDYRLAVVNQFSQVVFLSSLVDVKSKLRDDVGAVTGGRLMAAAAELDLVALVPPAPRRLGAPQLPAAINPIATGRRRLLAASLGALATALPVAFWLSIRRQPLVSPSRSGDEG